jgi:chemotaxis protein methyltransferase CheR
MTKMLAARPELAHWQPPAPLSPAQFERLRDAIAAYGGVYLDATQRRMLEGALASRLASTGMSLAAYEHELLAPLGRAELRRLAELLLNHETFFFRNAAQLYALRTELLPEIDRRKPAGEPIRIWSAGCATGEEAYSIAIAAHEALGHTGRPLEIYGTDLSELALAKARTGFYRGRSLQNVSPARRERFFLAEGDGYVVCDLLRASVRFAQLNLLEPFQPFVQGCDAIFCQNVTIYFQPVARRELIARFFASLPAGGLLFLGFSETLWNVFDGFRTREAAGTFVYYKESQKQSSGQHVVQRQSAPVRPAAPGRRWSSERRSRATSANLQGAAIAGGHAAAVPSVASLAAARSQADSGELEKAEALLLALLDQDALHEEAYLLLGQIYLRQGAWPAAVTVLERGRYLRPGDPLVSFHLANAYRASERAELAAREYRAALRKLEPHPPDALLDGAAVSWLRQTCERQLEQLLGSQPKQ